MGLLFATLQILKYLKKFFTHCLLEKVSTGLGFNLDLEHPENMNPDIAIKLVELFQGLTESTTKSASALDMLEKGQLKARRS